MEKRTLSSEGPEITRLGFGAWALAGPSRFGWGAVDDDESIDAIRHAIESGINWVDTAAFYGKGHSEEVVGRAIKPWKAGEEVYLFTKCGLRWYGDDPDEPATNNLQPGSIRFECDRSLARLGVDSIDLYQFHWPDHLGTPVEDSWATMIELVEAGKVRWIGVSNFTVEMLERCEALRRIDSVQPPLNLLDRAALDEVIPWARDHGTGVIVYSPMASGLLTGAFDKSRAVELPLTDWRRTAPHFIEPQLSANLEIVGKLNAIAAGLGITLPELAVAWTLSISGVTGAIVGARRKSQVDGWIRSAGVRLDPGTLAEIESAVSLDVPEAASGTQSN